MYVSIDMDSLCFLHKHANIDVVANLDFIRCKHHDTHLLSLTDYQALDHIADKQLSTLYQNVTGHVSPYFGSHLRMVLLELAEKFPESDADPAETEVQASWLQARYPDGVKGYFYVKGAKLPSMGQPPLFPKLACTEEDSRNATRRQAARAAQLAQAATATPVAPTANAAVKRPTTSVMRPRSGVCKEIWETLDAEKQATGAIPDRTRVKELAAQKGWNPNTASVQSAAWRKHQPTG